MYLFIYLDRDLDPPPNVQHKVTSMHFVKETCMSFELHVVQDNANMSCAPFHYLRPESLLYRVYI